MLDSLRIKNFRCFEDLEIESLGRVNLIVGKNNVGKSTLLEALAVFAIGQGISDNLSAFNRIRQISSLILNRRNRHFNEVSSPSEAKKIASIIYRDKTKEKSSFFSIGNMSDEYTTKIGFRNFEGKATVESNINKRSFHLKIDGSLTIDAKNSLSEQRSADSIIDAIFDQPLTQDNVTPYAFSNSNLDQEEELDKLFDIAKKEGLKQAVISFLRSIDQRISDIDFVNLPINEDDEFNFQGTVGIITVGSEKPTLLASLGEGVSRLLQIYLNALKARSGYLMIDEFENGLHYSIQEEVWQKLFQLAEELDIQVFATTHSRDTIDAFNKVTLKHPEIKGNIISLARSVAKSEERKIFATVYDEQSGDIEMLEQTGIEVR